VWMSHGDKVPAAPPSFSVTAFTDSAPIAAIEHETRPWFGLQFHPEVTHTQSGSDILRRFVRDIAGCEATWTPSSIVERAVASVRRQVGDGRAVTCRPCEWERLD